MASAGLAIPSCAHLGWRWFERQDESSSIAKPPNSKTTVGDMNGITRVLYSRRLTIRRTFPWMVDVRSGAAYLNYLHLAYNMTWYNISVCGTWPADAYTRTTTSPLACAMHNKLSKIHVWKVGHISHLTDIKLVGDFMTACMTERSQEGCESSSTSLILVLGTQSCKQEYHQIPKS